VLPSGTQLVYKNRVAWARSYLTKALLLESPQRGAFLITERGKALLAENPQTLRVKQLKKYPEFAAFHSSGSKQEKAETDAADEEHEATPEEIFEKAYQELRSGLADELLQQITANSPEFFERLVVKLLVKMG